MATIPSWEDDPKTWDTLVLAGKPWPGVWMADVDGGQDTDIKKSAGADGATVTYKGYRLKKVNLSGRITARQWARFQELLPDIEPAAGKKELEPVDAVHPELAVRKVLSIAVLNVKTSRRQKGFFDIAIDAVEFNKPKPGKKSVTSTPTSSASDKPAYQKVPLVTPDFTPHRPSDDADP